MAVRPMIVSPQDRPRSLNVVGEQITVLASGAQTNSYEIFLQSGPEGSGPPPHSHPWDEAFFVIRGDVAFGVGEIESVATPGTLVQLPGGTTHWFRFGPGGGEMLSLTSAAGAAAFFTEVDEKVSPQDSDLGKLLGIAASHRLSVVVPMP
jgi:quercetin dioxygenase-like cupin family protein